MGSPATLFGILFRYFLFQTVTINSSLREDVGVRQSSPQAKAHARDLEKESRNAKKPGNFKKFQNRRASRHPTQNRLL
ncbi:MAG: hypothetical protein LBM17_02960 [Candidatus Accumulibacter sp.]|jgi:hypothetical protein|nr:hypothetical protein [Accumulibacter sp.]